MFSNISLGNINLNVFLNTIFVSIPEEFFIIMFTLILIGEFDYWMEEECHKIFDRWDYFRVFLPAVTAAVIINILRCTNLNANIISMISALTVSTQLA